MSKVLKEQEGATEMEERRVLKAESMARAKAVRDQSWNAEGAEQADGLERRAGVLGDARTR